MMKWIRWMVLTVMAIASTVGAVGTVAHAASGVVQTAPIASGSANVASCDPGSTWTYTFTKDAQGRVSSAQVSGIAAACSGGSLSLTLVGPSSSSTGSIVTLSGCSPTCSASVPFTTNPPFPADATSARAVIAGP